MTKNADRKKAARAYQAAHPGTPYRDALQAIDARKGTVHQLGPQDLPLQPRSGGAAALHDQIEAVVNLLDHPTRPLSDAERVELATALEELNTRAEPTLIGLVDKLSADEPGGTVIDEGWHVLDPGRGPRPNREQVLAYCDLMGLEPSDETVARLEELTTWNLLAGANRSVPEAVAKQRTQPSPESRERFDSAFGLGSRTNH
ncbi:hypothetical protein O4328_43710 [Rhodococcus opacus]|uniref:DUF222 domain-containing protein n=1 Tax=Rhodococcus opacus TaxID=37919 RepID=A0AAX3YT18_RHOOP|nr:hypothetical protein [Rhodococcus opacus]MCZ4590448.1 hypothetical protein [Rhodococcus opacus]WLF51277.1 hypothetical protein Q5707_38600 [Rhodococcus opacus]